LVRRKHAAPTDTLGEIQSLADRLSDWVAANRALAIAVTAGILFAAAAVGGYLSWSARQANRAASAVSALRDEFLVAMGGSPGDLQAPEPANPETARGVRQEFANRFLELAKEQAGTSAALEARLQAGALVAELGEPDSALEIWQQGLAEAERGSALRGLLLGRIARAHERAGRLGEAAEAHERAAALTDFPLRHLALADAARCWAEAGDADRAVRDYERLRSEAPDLQLPAHLEARLRELTARHQAAAAPRP
jgi:tetratricopeptide (TPR) repeat protein